MESQFWGLLRLQAFWINGKVNKPGTKGGRKLLNLFFDILFLDGFGEIRSQRTGMVSMVQK